MLGIRFALARVRALFRRDATMDEIHEELQFHVEMRTNELVRQGQDAHSARQAALRRFGNLSVIQDRGYDVRGGGVLDTIVQDAKYGIRQLRRDLSFSIVAIVTLGLGIGVSTALFSVIDAALLRPLPYANPEELITLHVEEARPGRSPGRYAPSMTDIRTWRTLTSVISHAGMGRVRGFMPRIVDSGTPARLIVAEASEDFLDTYGVRPMLGRSIHVDDTREGAPAVALLGHAFWQREFGADPKVVGKTLRIQNEPITIIGVLPAGFYTTTAVWRARQFSTPWLDRRGSGTPVIARLRPGVSPAAAAAAFDAVLPAAADGTADTTSRVVIESMYDDETGGFGATIRVLSMAVGLILLIACVNVAGLTFARGATRDVELAIRASIGAGRGRLVRQLLTESVLLAAGGTITGVLLAYVSLESLVALVPLSLPANSPVAINVTVLAFAVVLSAVTALLVGLMPALKLSRAPNRMSTVLSVGGRHRAPLSKRAGQWLIAIEIALAFVLLVGSGLILRSFAKLVSVDLGYDTANVLTMEVEPLEQTTPLRREYYLSLLAALRQLPEVMSAGAIDQHSLIGGGTFGFPLADTGASIAGAERTVLPGYFEAMGVRPLAGRLFEEADLGAGEAAVVNVATSRQYFGGNAIGHTITLGMKPKRPVRIVGVVPSIRHGGPGARPVEPQLYILPDPIPSPPAEALTLAMVMRLRTGAALPADRLKSIAEGLGPRVLVEPARPAAALVSQHVEKPRNRMVLLTLLGLFGFVLTLVGIFSMTAYAVARRTREIGVRLALGARPAQVVRGMVRDVVWPVVLGLVAGLAGAYYATRVIKNFLFQTVPYDPATLVAVVVLLAVAAGLAAWVPARWAASIDAWRTLRAE